MDEMASPDYALDSIYCSPSDHGGINGIFVVKDDGPDRDTVVTVRYGKNDQLKSREYNVDRYPKR
jgi:hypothetical protein